MDDAQPSNSIENKEPAPRGPRWLVLLAIGVSLLLVLLVVVWLIVRRGSGEHEVEAIVEVEVAPVQRGEVREYVEGGGTLNALPGREASFSGATAGKVTRVLVQVGQHVSTGQVMAELDRSVLAAQVRQAVLGREEHLGGAADRDRAHRIGIRTPSRSAASSASG